MLDYPNTNPAKPPHVEKLHMGQKSLVLARYWYKLTEATVDNRNRYRRVCISHLRTTVTFEVRSVRDVKCSNAV